MSERGPVRPCNFHTVVIGFFCWSHRALSVEMVALVFVLTGEGKNINI